ncbi:hypothetical protein EJP02_439 [Escherichia phage EJP2]|mgnify:CR=1 FL=1|nr:hypothetical protein EJP02_439 [Escherichia phage EJP2]
MKIFKFIAASVLALSLSACDRVTEERSHEFALPSELVQAGCKIYRMRAESGVTLYALYCPNSTTTTSYTSGKQTHHVTTYSN